MDDLEHVLPQGHEYHDRIFYDKRAGQYYDRATDFYLTVEEASAFIPALRS